MNKLLVTFLTLACAPMFGMEKGAELTDMTHVLAATDPKKICLRVTNTLFGVKLWVALKKDEDSEPEAGVAGTFDVGTSNRALADWSKYGEILPGSRTSSYVTYLIVATKEGAHPIYKGKIRAPVTQEGNSVIISIKI